MIHTGDCIEWLATLEAKSVDHVITDPPYSEHVTSKSRRAVLPDAAKGPKCNRSRTRDLGFKAITLTEVDAVAFHCARLARRWVLVFCDTEIVHWWMGALVRWGLDHVRVGTWIKPGSAPQFTGDRPSSGTESIVIAHPKGRKRWNGGGHAAVWTCPIVMQCSGHRYDRLHTTQKPLPLMIDLIEDFTSPGDLIIDPFAGSGTTGVAALRRSRRFLGCEMQDAYARRANERLTAEIEGSTIQAREAGQLPLLGGAT